MSEALRVWVWGHIGSDSVLCVSAGLEDVIQTEPWTQGSQGVLRKAPRAEEEHPLHHHPHLLLLVLSAPSHTRAPAALAQVVGEHRDASPLSPALLSSMAAPIGLGEEHRGAEGLA